VKKLHRPDLFAWSCFDESRDLDFNGHLLVQAEGPNIAFDPMPPSDHDARQISDLGGVDLVMISTADHVRAAAAFVERWGAEVAAPAAERGLGELATLGVDHWLEDDALRGGVRCLWMRGSKTPGELAFLLPDGETLITGDLVRGQRAGSLNLLPDEKLSDRGAALRSVARLAELGGVRAVLVGDGQSIYREGRERLRELLRA